MKILFAASEALPFIASGGLADVAGSLPKAIRAEQHVCRVVLPLYSDIDPRLREGMSFVCNFNVPLAWRNQYCGVFTAKVDGVQFYLLDNEYYFKRRGIYGFFDDGERFAFFAKACLEMLQYIDFEPDLIHANDWQTALIPVFLNAFYRHIPRYSELKTVLTIHNIQYQGKYDERVSADVLGLPEEQRRLVEYDGCTNYLKGGICAADAVTTVSPTYSREIMDPWYAYGLDGILRQNSFKLTGILNGIDVVGYNPATDPVIAQNYSLEDVSLREENRRELADQVGLPLGENTMLIGIVSRLVAQKGMDLIRYILPRMLAEHRDLAVAMVGSGDREYEEFFAEMRRRFPGQMGFVQGFIPPLARKIYAGCDVFLMPSRSEPCGLAQMVACRYGAVPVVRQTGGLKDSIVDFDTPGGGNGYTFYSYNADDMLGAILRAKAAFDDREGWQEKIAAVMACDFSWERSAGEYLKLYRKLL